MTRTKAQNGITLISLIVTIIVLLILAGVSINAVFSDNGIIKKAQEAQNKMNEAVQKDMEDINELTNLLDSYMNGTGSNSGSSGGDSTTETPIITDSSLTSNDRVATTSETVIAQDIKGNQVVVLGGFKIAADSGTSVQQGIVIEDVDGNQFVWIPVSNIDGSDTNPIILDDGTEKVIILGRYTFDGTYNSETEKMEGTGAETLVQKGSDYEGIVTINSYYKELSTYRESNGLRENGTNTTAKNLKEFVEQAEKNKGYYIARYEASYGSGSSTSDWKPLSQASTAYSTSSMSYKKGTLWNFITQGDAAKVCQNMYSGNTYVESDLINSYAWDTAIVYIQAMGNNNYANANRDTTGNTSLINTGSTGDEVCKIFDMAGNLLEWTTEYSLTTSSGNLTPCTFRGGYIERFFLYLIIPRRFYFVLLWKNTYF